MPPLANGVTGQGLGGRSEATEAGNPVLDDVAYLPTDNQSPQPTQDLGADTVGLGKIASGGRDHGENRLGGQGGGEQRLGEPAGSRGKRPWRLADWRDPSCGAGAKGKSALGFRGAGINVLEGGRGPGEKRLGVQGRGDERLCLYAMSSNAPGLPNPQPGRGICVFAPQQML